MPTKEGLLQFCVASIDVGAKLNGAIRGNPDGCIGQMDRQVRGEANDRPLLTAKDTVNPLSIPARLGGQDLFGQIDRSRDTYTAMTEGTLSAREEAA